MTDAPESPLRLREISFLTGVPPIALECGDLLLEPAYAFRDNFRRNLALAELPSRLAGWSALTNYAENVARLNAGIPFGSDAHVEGSSSFVKSRAAAFSVAYQQVWKSIGNDPKMSTERIKEIGLQHIDVLYESAAAQVDVGLEALLVGVTFGAWTAFEALLADVWEVALNFGPKDWPRSIAKSSGSTNKAQSKSVPITALDELNYDLRAKMGTLLIRRRKVDFQSLSSLRRAYKTVFGGQADQIFDDHPKLVILEAVRNLHAHRGGKVDELFKKQTASDQQFGSMTLGSQVRLDGATVKSLLEAAVNSATELLHFVDGKLAEHTRDYRDEDHEDIRQSMRSMTSPGSTWMRTSKWRLFKRALRQLFTKPWSR